MLAFAGGAQSVPPLINYQGRIASPDGSPLPTADYQLIFRIYDAATNGMLKWGPQIFDGIVGTAGHGAKAPVVQGYFNVVLGPVDTNGISLAMAFAASNRFVEVTVGNRPPILPRQQIVSTPYALTAGSLIRDLQEALCPPGTIIAFGGTNVPTGWQLCDGTAFSSNSYPRLFSAIGKAWGEGYTNISGVQVKVQGTDFNVPDLRGIFLRGVNGSRFDFFSASTNSLDPEALSRTNAYAGGNSGNTVGTYQEDALKIHRHRIRRMVISGGLNNPSAIYADDEGTAAYNGNYSGDVINNSGDSTEARPKNAYVNYIIKY